MPSTREILQGFREMTEAIKANTSEVNSAISKVEELIDAHNNHADVVEDVLVNHTQDMKSSNDKINDTLQEMLANADREWGDQEYQESTGTEPPFHREGQDPCQDEEQGYWNNTTEPEPNPPMPMPPPPTRDYWKHMWPAMQQSNKRAGLNTMGQDVNEKRVKIEGPHWVSSRTLILHARLLGFALYP